MQEVSVRGPASAGGLLHHQVHHAVQLSASVHTNATQSSPEADRHSSGEEETSPCHSPIDLSSNCNPTSEAPMLAAAPATNSSSASPAMTAGFDARALLTAKKFAEFLQRQKELVEGLPPTTTTTTISGKATIKRSRDSIGEELDDEEENGTTKLEDESKPHSITSHEFIRARPEPRSDSPSAESAGGSSSASFGHQEAGHGREVKKRRLDELLSKKFSVADSPPNSSASFSPPPLVTSSTTFDSAKRTNRRKPSSPMSTISAPSSGLSLRPPSELFASVDNLSTSPKTTSTSPRHSPIPRSSSKSPTRSFPSKHEESSDSDVLKAQLLQIQLQAALLSGAFNSGNGFPGLPAASAPLLYGYYVQMLQSQQQKLLEDLASRQQKSRLDNRDSSMRSHETNFSSPSKTSSIFSQLSMVPTIEASRRHSSFSPKISASTPPYSPSLLGRHDESPLSPSDDRRRRAPRALTGRYVRTGTGASPHVLQLLKKKVQERMKLRELLGENSHLYFGSGNKNKKSAAAKGRQHGNCNVTSNSFSVKNKF